MNKIGLNGLGTDTKQKTGIYFSERTDGDKSKEILNVAQEYIDRFSNLSSAEKSFSLLVSKEAMILRNREEAYSKLLEILSPDL